MAGSDEELMGASWSGSASQLRQNRLYRYLKSLKVFEMPGCHGLVSDLECSILDCALPGANAVTLLSRFCKRYGY